MVKGGYYYFDLKTIKKMSKLTRKFVADWLEKTDWDSVIYSPTIEWKHPVTEDLDRNVVGLGRSSLHKPTQSYQSIEKVVDKKMVKGQPKYLVHWRGHEDITTRFPTID